MQSIRSSPECTRVNRSPWKKITSISVYGLISLITLFTIILLICWYHVIILPSHSEMKAVILTNPSRHIPQPFVVIFPVMITFLNNTGTSSVGVFLLIIIYLIVSRVSTCCIIQYKKEMGRIINYGIRENYPGWKILSLSPWWEIVIQNQNDGFA